MKASNVFFSLVLIISITSYSYAQDYTFKVIASSGSSATQSGAALKVGSKLQNADKVVVKDKSFVGLSYAKGGTVQISKPGTYTITDLEKGLASSKKSVSQKFANYVIGEVTKAGDVDIHKNPYKYQNVTGSVERETFKSAIVLEAPDKSKFFKDTYTLQWHHLAGNKTYVLSILNDFDEVVKTVEVADTLYTINVNEETNKDIELIKISIKGKEQPIGKKAEFVLARPTTKEMAEFKKGWRHEKHSHHGEVTANSKLDDALYLEEHGMLLDAMATYQEAIKLEPEDESFVIAYHQFLMRHAIGKQSFIDEEKAENK
jgi:hypothetical protein